MTRILTVALLCGAVAFGQDGVNWPQFRGARASGVADGYETPVRWSIETKENVRWRTPIPGLGHSSPVIWKDRLFVTTAIDAEKESSLKVGLYGSIAPVKDDSEQSWKVYCLNKKTGQIVWERLAVKGMPEKPRHPKATHANPSVATDGRHVVAFFGSEGLFCYNMEGELIWEKDLGVLDAGFFVAPDAQWGFASSPVIHNGKVLIQCDVLSEQYLLALKVTDGSEVWRTKRDDYPTWSTPTVFAAGSRTQVVVNGFKHIGGYDAETGEEIWRLRGGGDIPVPAPVIGDGLFFISNAHGPASPIYAIRATARGDISLAEGKTSNEHVAWSTPRGGSYLATPLVYGDYLYVCRGNGVLSCYTAKTGKRHYERRLGEGTTGFTPSMVAGDGKVYVTSEDGDVYVIQAGPKLEILATNQMDEVCMASPAISEGVIYWRTRGHLVAVGE